MKKREEAAAIQQLGIAEKMAKLSETTMPQVKDRIEQAFIDEHKQSTESQYRPQAIADSRVVYTLSGGQ